MTRILLRACLSMAVWLCLTEIWCPGNLYAQPVQIPANIPNVHPRIYAGVNSKDNLNSKFTQVAWCREYIDDLKKETQPYLEHFKTDTSWLVSRLQMYWKTHHTDIYIKGTNFLRAEGQASVPTVRYAGSRDWASDYIVPSIGNVRPYADGPDGKVYMINKRNEGEWVSPEKTGLVIERINQRILEVAQNAAFLYWFTGEVTYARLAASVLKPYIAGLYYRKFPVNTVDTQESYLTGLTSFEVIHEEAIVPATVCYDFLYNYLQQTAPGFGKKFADPVFQKMADNIIEKGVPDNNWNIFEMRYLSYLALALDNNSSYANGKGISYYLDVIYNRESPRQRSFIKCLDGFDPKVATWHEAPSYCLHVCEDMTQIALLNDQVMPGKQDRLLTTLKKATMATAEYLFPNKRITAFGDSHYDELSTDNLEFAIALTRKYNDSDELKFTRLLQFINTENKPRPTKKSLFSLFFYVDRLKAAPKATLEDFASPAFFASNQSWFVQRNGFSENNGLMISANASQGNHSHANGVNMELYGKGYPLAPDFSNGESYWHSGYREFYSQFAAHNTVVVDGKSAYGVMLTAIPFKLLNNYPQAEKQSGYFKPVTFANIVFNEPSTNATQLRLLSTVRISDTSGYYVDIFRSKRADGKDIKHEYVYHNLGQQFGLQETNGNQLTLQPTTDLGTAKGDVKGYDYFTDKRSIAYDKDFIANFKLAVETKPVVQMNLWMKGDKNRQLYLANSPKSYALNTGVVPAEIASLDVPTLLVRQPGEAWTHPFAAVIEPSYVGGNSVMSTSYFNSTAPNSEFVGIKVNCADKSTQYILSDVKGTQLNEYQHLKFTGTYGVAAEKKGQLQYLFLGQGTVLAVREYRLEAISGNLTAAFQQDKDVFRLFAQQPLKLTLPYKGNAQTPELTVTDKLGKTKVYTGRIDNSANNKLATFVIDAETSNGVSLKISK
ncbi:hypothetical protein ABDD95_23035 [Mucilaginibacter sp. PAMB04274]|uniref:hypothetical protein n=1 Tax=Mucilaginibacter sp. PAMB04274 TaxID=3138568 RepID=UPI0031F66D9E